jgi:hypothetical protein
MSRTRINRGFFNFQQCLNAPNLSLTAYPSERFVRIGNFGFLANRKRAELLPLCFHLVRRHTTATSRITPLRSQKLLAILALPQMRWTAESHRAVHRCRAPTSFSSKGHRCRTSLHFNGLQYGPIPVGRGKPRASEPRAWSCLAEEAGPCELSFTSFAN